MSELNDDFFTSSSAELNALVEAERVLLGAERRTRKEWEKTCLELSAVQVRRRSLAKEELDALEAQEKRDRKRKARGGMNE